MCSFKYILIGVYYGCIICALNRAYLNILTLFFYKCVWSRQTQISRIKFFHYGGTQAMKPGMAQRSQRCGGGPRPYRFNVGTER